MTEREKHTLLYHVRLIHLMAAAALYLAGAGLARYLGAQVDLSVFGLGFAWLLCLLLGTFLLGDHFNIPFISPVLPAEVSLRSKGEWKDSVPTNILLFGSLSFLSAAGVLTILMGVSGLITPAVAVVLAGQFLCSSLLVMPGLNLRHSGVGEFFLSIWLVALPPALSFLTQYGEFHRFLTLGIFPLFPIHLALVLTLRLRSYPEDIRSGRKTIMVRLGWVRGVFLHNLLLLSGFLLFGAGILFGLPPRIVLPVYLVLPPVGYLIWIYNGLEGGAPVRWRLIIFLALVGFFLPVYLIVFTAWIY